MARLDELAGELRTAGAGAEALAADLSSYDGLATVTADIRLLISNAGVGGYAPLTDVAAAGLRLGETVCVPGLENQDAALKTLLDGEAALLDGGARKALATRYRQP